MQTLFNLKDPALETIHYQNKDSFVPAATVLVEKILEEITNKQYKNDLDVVTNSKHVKSLNLLIKNRFGLDCDITDKKIFTGSVATVYAPVSVEMTDYTLFDMSFDLQRELAMYVEEKKDLLLAKVIKKSTVNFKHARVTNYYSGIRVHISIGFFTLCNKIRAQAKEIVAVLLHEIGHVFMGFSYHYKLNAINLTAVSVIDEINNNNIDKAVYILNNNIQNKKDIIINNNDKKIRYDISAAIVNQYIDLNKEFKYNYLDINNEAVADNFAVRFNVGRELVSALDKLDTWCAQEYGTSEKRFYSKFYTETDTISILENEIDPNDLSFRNVVKVIATFSLYLLVSLSLLLGGYIIGVIASVLFFANITSGLGSYDKAYDRFKRIKFAIINNLKDLTLNKRIIKDLIDQIDFIDEVIKKYPEDGRNFIEKFIETMFSEGRSAKYYREMQQDIEELLNNKLFIHAAKLKVS